MTGTVDEWPATPRGSTPTTPVIIIIVVVRHRCLRQLRASPDGDQGRWTRCEESAVIAATALRLIRQTVATPPGNCAAETGDLFVAQLLRRELVVAVDYVYAGLLRDKASVLDGHRVMDVREGDRVDGTAVRASVLGPNPI